MISKAADVKRYIAELPTERRVAIEKLRRLCQQHLKGYEEGMDFGMPVYKRNGVAEIAFASQKQYISFYVMKKEVLDEFRGALPNAKIGKGCVRFAKPERIDFNVLGQVLSRTAKSKSAPC
jgi:uncharacterized protein YdhG (YjbR/CyaY superfamily)